MNKVLYQNKEEMDDYKFYKPLSTVETHEYKMWARENYKTNSKINPLWHPVVKEECQKMNEERKNLEAWLKNWKTQHENLFWKGSCFCSVHKKV